MKSRAALVCEFILIGLVFSASIQSTQGQLCHQLTDEEHHEDFNDLVSAGTGTNAQIPIGFAFSETGSNNNVSYTADDGSSATGDTYSYGGGPNDRALGELTTANLSSILGGCFVNVTGHDISTITISYTGEQWRLGADDGNTDKLDFQISTDATSLNDGSATWNNVNSLDFESPHIAGTAGALAGNAAANRTGKGPITVFLGAVVPHGGIFFIRWVPEIIAGANDALAIDDFTIYTPRAKITTFSATPNGAQRNIAIDGTARPPGAAVSLEKSSNLVNWSGVGVVASDAGDGSFSFNLSEPLTTATQFYKTE